LRARGFHIFEARWDNHLEQIETFGAAKVIVGVHGAGLANALFGRSDGLLIEIQAQNARKTTGLHWAASAGMDYRCLLGGPEGERQSFALDPVAALREIDGLLA
jgi:capsular polysaccharide biosynthesis protein